VEEKTVISHCPPTETIGSCGSQSGILVAASFVLMGSCGCQRGILEAPSPTKLCFFAFFDKILRIPKWGLGGTILGSRRDPLGIHLGSSSPQAIPTRPALRASSECLKACVMISRNQLQANLQVTITYLTDCRASTFCLEGEIGGP